ncbi:MAG: hypothetical protein RIT02_243 [Planctomycetota bacterium]
MQSGGAPEQQGDCHRPEAAQQQQAGQCGLSDLHQFHALAAEECCRGTGEREYGGEQGAMAEPAEAIGKGGGKLSPQDSHPERWQDGQGAGLREPEDSGGDEQGVNDESGDGGDCHEQDLPSAAWVQLQVHSHEQYGGGDADLRVSCGGCSHTGQPADFVEQEIQQVGHGGIGGIVQCVRRFFWGADRV